MTQKRIALVTGAGRGIGFEVARELAQKGIQVILAARDPEKGRAAVQKIEREGFKDVSFVEMDISSDESVKHAADDVKKRFGRLDILVNNAGILLDTDNESTNSILKSGLDVIRETLETNTYGAIRTSQNFVPLMLPGHYGRIVNISSGMGALNEMNGQYPGYRLSKTALNAVTRILADELAGTGILVNSACPGWVKTDMGGAGAERSLPEGADTIVWLATLPDQGPTGGFFRDREPISW